MIKYTSFYVKVFTCLHKSSLFSNPLGVTRIRQILLYYNKLHTDKTNALLMPSNQCFIVVTTTYVFAHATGTEM